MAKRPGDPAEAAVPKRARLVPPVPRTSTALAPLTSVPEQLDVDAALRTRKHEILALHRAMKQAREATNTRAWQLLPRHMRRRAASHNLLRLPSRLRNKARAELRASNTTPKTRSVMRRRAPERTLTGFVRRRATLMRRAARSDRRWLETHLWHAKRFRMSLDKQAQDGGPGTFGFALAESPHQKSFRRSARYGSGPPTLHDASYQRVFRLVACAPKRHPALATQRLQLLLYLAGALHGWEDAWTSGARLCSTTLLQRPSGARANEAHALFLAPVAPIQVLWVPRQNTRRECHVWVHPAGAHDVHQLLVQALDAMHAEARRTTKHKSVLPQRWDVPVSVRVDELESAPPPALAAGVHETRRGHVHELDKVQLGPNEGYNIFELSGTEVGRVLGGVLQPVEPTSHEDGIRRRLFARIVGKEDAIQPSHLAHGTMLSLVVHDPRVTFPPRNVPYPRAGVYRPLPALEHDGTPVLTEARFFGYAHLPTYTQGAIDGRRAQLAPGRQLTPLPTDDCVPVVLVATSHNTPLSAGYTLLVPRGWGRAFWHALVHTGARVLGQEQLRQRHLNEGLPSFPHDWVATRAYAAQESEASERRAQAWSRRPPAKRVNFAQGDAANAHPFGGMALWADALRNGAQADTSGVPVATPVVPASWSRLVDGAQRGPVARYTRLASLWTRRAYGDGVALAPLAPPIGQLHNAVVMVVLRASRRGAFQALATVHLPPTLDATYAWRTSLDPPTRDKAAARTALEALERQSPPPHIGAVTTGDYALADGRGRAIASISLLAWLELERREAAIAAQAAPHRWGLRKRNPVALAHLVLVRNPAGGVVRAASAHLLPT